MCLRMAICIQKKARYVIYLCEIPNLDFEWCFVDAEDLYVVNQSRCFLIAFELYLMPPPLTIRDIYIIRIERLLHYLLSGELLLVRYFRSTSYLKF